VHTAHEMFSAELFGGAGPVDERDGELTGGCAGSNGYGNRDGRAWGSAGGSVGGCAGSNGCGNGDGSGLGSPGGDGWGNDERHGGGNKEGTYTNFAVMKSQSETFSAGLK
jgi:hypothetical protein